MLIYIYLVLWNVLDKDVVHSWIALIWMYLVKKRYHSMHTLLENIEASYLGIFCAFDFFKTPNGLGTLPIVRFQYIFLLYITRISSLPVESVTLF